MGGKFKKFGRRAVSLLRSQSKYVYVYVLSVYKMVIKFECAVYSGIQVQ